MDPEAPDGLFWFQGELVDIGDTHVGGKLQPTADVLLPGRSGHLVWLERNRAASCLSGGGFFGISWHLFPRKNVVSTAAVGDPYRDGHTSLPGFQHDADVRCNDVEFLDLGDCVLGACPGKQAKPVAIHRSGGAGGLGGVDQIQRNHITAPVTDFEHSPNPQVGVVVAGTPGAGVNAGWL